MAQRASPYLMGLGEVEWRNRSLPMFSLCWLPAPFNLIWDFQATPGGGPRRSGTWRARSGRRWTRPVTVALGVPIGPAAGLLIRE
jgi:hypothetical protein